MCLGFQELPASSSKAFAPAPAVETSVLLGPRHDKVTISCPPSLPRCSLHTAFEESESRDPVAPGFYPGQTIPTIVSFKLDRFSSLSHSLNPQLNMSLVGELHRAGGSQTIICVSVSLEEGLKLWRHDATQEYLRRPNERICDPAIGLPGGTYSLPLTVQVPTTPRLPPSFQIASANFSVTYALKITLSCDEPARPGSRVILAESARPFEMMPETLPVRTPRYSETAFSVRAVKGESRWSITPHVPTTAFSPTGRIPLVLSLIPQSDSRQRYQVLVHIALSRREHAASSEITPRDVAGRAGLVKDECLVSSMAWFDVCDQDLDISTVLPIMTQNTWPHGYTTMLNIGPAGSEANGETTSVSSTFQLSSTLAFLPLGGERTLQHLLPSLPPAGVFTTPQSMSNFDMTAFRAKFPGTVRMLPIPITIGSVSEPRSAMYTTRWSDLHLDRAADTEVARMINGEAIGCEDGWIEAPPSYGEAIQSAPYVS